MAGRKVPHPPIPHLPIPPINPGQFDPFSPALIPPDFQQVGSINNWLPNCSIIVTGKYSKSSFSALLCYNSAARTGTFYQANGNGNVDLLQENTGWRNSWTIILPGVFGNSGYDGVLMYDQQAGFLAIYDTDGKGNLIYLHEDPTWRKSWTHIVVAPFTDSEYSGILFYDQSAGYAEIYSTHGHSQPKLLAKYDDWRTTWTTIVAGQMTAKNTADGALFADLFFYEGSTGYGETYATNGKGGICMLGAQSGFPVANSVLPGNFGCQANGNEWTNLLFFAPSTNVGTIWAYSFQQPQSNGLYNLWGPVETISLPILGGRVTNKARVEGRWVVPNPIVSRPWSVIITGKFWMIDSRDGYFGTNGKYPQYRIFYNGGFSDLLFYDNESGSIQFYLKVPALTTPQEPLCGYASARSVLPGETIQFFASSQVGNYAIDIYRQGIDRVYVGSVPVTGQARAYGISQTAYRDGAGWPVVASFTVPAQWPSGLYLAHLNTSEYVSSGGSVLGPLMARSKKTSQKAGTTAPDVSAAAFQGPPGSNAYTYDIPFVVRPSSPGKRARILIAAADTTYEAYNYWGGRCLYGHGCGELYQGSPAISFIWSNPYADWLLPRALSVSFLRPFVSAAGYTRMQTFEVPLIQWLERNGFAYDMCAASDLDQYGDLISNYQMFVSVGHDEYWSQGMRQAVEDFIGHGGNAAFLSGNTCWWCVSFSPDGTQMFCGKDKSIDPATILWNDLNLPATSLCGTNQYAAWPNVPRILPSDPPPDPNQYFVVRDASHWAFEGTFLSNGEHFGVYWLPDGTFVCAIGGETNDGGTTGVIATAKLDDNHIGTMVSLQRRPGPVSRAKKQKGKRSKAAAASGGIIFNAASINWVLALSQEQGLWNTADQITWNVFNRMS
jgi:hypothetical protein